MLSHRSLRKTRPNKSRVAVLCSIAVSDDRHVYTMYRNTAGYRVLSEEVYSMGYSLRLGLDSLGSQLTFRNLTPVSANMQRKIYEYIVAVGVSKT